MRWAKFLLFTVLLSTPVTLLAQAEDTDASRLERLKVLKADGVGKSTSGSVPSMHIAEGVVKGNVFGIARFKATFNNSNSWWSYTENGSRGTCVRGSGPVFLTTPDGSTIEMQQAGLSCNPAADPTNLLDAGTYLIVGGTGRFSGATGTGNVVTGFKNGQASIHLDGNIILGEDAKSNGEDEDEESDRVNAKSLNGNIILDGDAKSNRKDAESDRVNVKLEEENRP